MYPLNDRVPFQILLKNPIRLVLFEIKPKFLAVLSHFPCNTVLSTTDRTLIDRLVGTLIQGFPSDRCSPNGQPVHPPAVGEACFMDIPRRV